MGIDDVDARETNSQRVMAKSHAWQSWENVFALKKAIEVSGWKTKKDDKLVIEALEGLALDNSLGNPQGAKIHPPRGPLRHDRLLHSEGRERQA